MHHRKLPPLVTIHTYSRECIGDHLVNGSLFASSLSRAWPSANLAMYLPFTLEARCLVRKLFHVNGTTASGNLDVGIYDERGTRIVSAGSTAQSGTSAIQEFDIADTELGPGGFYLAMAMDGTTGTSIAMGVALGALAMRAAGVLQQSSAFPLPANATFAQMGQAFVPYFGATTRAVI